MNDTQDTSDAIFSMIRDFFEGNDAKAEAWMACPNPMIGGISPEEMIEIGNGGKLLKFVRQSLEENVR